jgi:hypothetical protein
LRSAAVRHICSGAFVVVEHQVGKKRQARCPVDASGRNPQDENVSVAEPERRVFAIKPSGDWLSNKIEAIPRQGERGYGVKAYDLRAFHA